MAFLTNTFFDKDLGKPTLREEENKTDLFVMCCIFDSNNFVNFNQATLSKCSIEELDILRRVNSSNFVQNLGVYYLEDNKTISGDVIQIIGYTCQQNIYLPLYLTQVMALLDFEFSSSSTVTAKLLKVIKKIAAQSCDHLLNILKDKSCIFKLTFPVLPAERHSLIRRHDLESQIEISDQISSIVQNSNCQHRDLKRLVYHLKNTTEISEQAYEEYISNLDDKSGIDKLDSTDDINKFIASSKCQEPDFQKILALTSSINWNTTSSYFLQRILYEVRKDVGNLEIIQKAFANQYRNLDMTDNRDKKLESQIFDTESLYILPCYFVPARNVIQDSSNKKANKLSRSDINKEEDVTFEMKTRVMKKTTDMKQIVKQLRLYEARYPANNELNYYIGISVNEEIFFPRKKEDFIKILKENIADWKIGNKEGRYGIKACGKRFKLNNKTYTNTERHQMPDIFEHSSMVQKKYFKGMKSFDLIISKDDLSVQKVILSRDDGFEASEKFRNISNIVENSNCADFEFVKLVSALWNQESLSQGSLVKYCNNNDLDIEKVEKLSVGSDHRQVIKLSSTVAPDFLLLVQLLARLNTPYLLDYCKYFFTSIPKLFEDRRSISNFFVSVLDFIQKKTNNKY